MNASSTLNLTDYIVAIGNQFFNLDEKDWNVEQDELSYETTDRNGFNGYVLKIEETADDYSNVVIDSFRAFLSWIYALFIKVSFIKASPKKNATIHLDKLQSNGYTNTQMAIDNRVRSRLLDIINEDVDQWQEKKRVINRKQGFSSNRIAKNQFNTSASSSADTNNHSLRINLFSASKKSHPKSIVVKKLPVFVQALFRDVP